MRRECLERLSRHRGLTIPTCITARARHTLPWCMPGSLTSGFPWSRWQRKRSRHSRCMRNPQFYVSDKRPTPYCLMSSVHKWCKNVFGLTLFIDEVNSVVSNNRSLNLDYFMLRDVEETKLVYLVWIHFLRAQYKRHYLFLQILNSKREDITQHIDVSISFLSCFESGGFLTIDEAVDIMKV